MLREPSHELVQAAARSLGLSPRVVNLWLDILSRPRSTSLAKALRSASHPENHEPSEPTGIGAASVYDTHELNVLCHYLERVKALRRQGVPLHKIATFVPVVPFDSSQAAEGTPSAREGAGVSQSASGAPLEPAPVPHPPHTDTSLAALHDDLGKVQDAIDFVLEENKQMQLLLSEMTQSLYHLLDLRADVRTMLKRLAPPLAASEQPHAPQIHKTGSSRSGDAQPAVRVLPWQPKPLAPTSEASAANSAYAPTDSPPEATAAASPPAEAAAPDHPFRIPT